MMITVLKRLDGLQSWALTAAIALAAVLLSGAVAAQPFQGKIAPYGGDSKSWWPEEEHAPAGAPNILVWMQDDVGFGQLGSYGGPIETPNVDALAARGLRYTNFHSTAICSPSRASFLAGRNHHAIGIGGHAAGPSGFPGYYGRIPKSAASLAKILKQNGYSTYALGKWDHMPNEHVSPVGPFDYWPSGQGFDRFYGFLAAETSNFEPVMWSDHTPAEKAGKPDYHLSIDLADKAIEWITAQRSIAPNRPFFMYWSTGAVHSPHHAPKRYIEKYRGKFDMGWDKARELILERQKRLGIVPGDAQLPPRPADLPAWDSLPAEERRMHARAMEVFAAQLDHADHEFGRILATLERTGQLENTIVVIVSDNGASAEGGLNGTHNGLNFVNGKPLTPMSENLQHYDEWGGPIVHGHYSAAWALAGNTPFNYYKQTVNEGGVIGPLVISWPKGIQDQGGIRRQFHHIIDLMPTLLDAAGVKAPQVVDGIKQQPIDGVSMAYTFKDADTPTHKKAQYFEMNGNRGIWLNGWKAVALYQPRPWNLLIDRRDPTKTAKWALYHVAEDFNERIDLADKYPRKLAELKDLFEAEARRNNVYPLLPDIRERPRMLAAYTLKERDNRWVFYPPGAGRVPEVLAPPTKNRSHTITAEVVIPEQGAEGVLVTQGGRQGGYALYLHEGRLVYAYNYIGEAQYVLRSKQPVPPGRAIVRLEFERTGQNRGHSRLFVNDHQIAEGEIPRTVPALYGLTDMFEVGRDGGTPVNDDYAVPYAFTGVLERVVVEVKGD